ncbi:FAD/NAD(P)-binding oxidoreductase [Sodalis sp. dw_96]|uniref:NAD(P)/FAD-dependent oxidoreductase n=1 Tax=Sodalis sp. dw_96 TaxID=2719794 RepID=UPI001BD3F9B3|nr:FAD/NAD(P)-binding oxidoreductase [Sodalis sp. dw_96]
MLDLDFNCELLIVGAGPAGLAAACAAAKSGISIIILDDNPFPGGQIWRDGPAVSLPEKARHYRRQLDQLPNVSLLCGAKLIAPVGEKQWLYEQETASGIIRYERLILCSGARELLLPFLGWTLAGVSGAGALQAFIKSGLPVKDQRIALAGSGPLLLAAAQAVKKAGGKVVLLAEQTPASRLARLFLGLWRWPDKLRQSFSLSDPHYRLNSTVLAAEGEGRIERVIVRQGRRRISVACDRLACGFGLLANIEPALALGCRIERQAIWVDEWQQTSREDIYAAGECAGVGGSELALVTGKIAGYAASGNREEAARLWRERRRWRRFAKMMERAFRLNDRLKQLPRPDTLVCRCEDVALQQISGAAGWRQAKIHSRCGMGACQGKVCGAATRFLLDWPLATPRLPLAPARLSTLVKMGERVDKNA